MNNRSLLFIPGNNASMLLNASIMNADSIIIDLEDAVSIQEKDAARILINHLLPYLLSLGTRIIIRINSIDTEFWQDDLNELVSFKEISILLPKVNTSEDILLVSNYLAELEKQHGLSENVIKLIPLIETAEGVENSYKIFTSSTRIEAALLGGEDLTADIQAKRTPGGEELSYSRYRIVNAARAAKIAVYDTPYTDIDDIEGLSRDTQKAKSIGFTGKASISPNHIQTINAIFSPTQDEVDYSLEVIDIIEQAEREGKGVVSLYGEMIDAPIVNRAKNTIKLATQIGGYKGIE